MLATTCYSRDELAEYLGGRADEELSDAIEVHLQRCDRCEDTISELDGGEDTLIRTLQVQGGEQEGDVPAWVERVAGRPYAAGSQAEAAAGDESLPPGDALGDYELLRVLGRGGMSVVFAARHQHLGREVALKVLLPRTQQHTVSRERFAREMRAVGGLDHPAIVRATDAGECNDTLYLVMERIDGVDLNHVSQTAGPLRLADACAIGVAVARGLAHAHALGIVHRDIKPSNVMLDQHGNVKILDFGLARMQSSACDVSLQTTMGQLLGTLDYMAPEQASGSDVDARADIYALGATLFKLFTGMPPHGRSNEVPVIEFLHRLATEEARSLDSCRSGLPSEIVALIRKMLHSDPAQRVASAGEAAELLQPFAQGADLPALAAAAEHHGSCSEDEDLASVKRCLTDIWPDQLTAGDVPPQAPVKPPVGLPGERPRRRGVEGGIAIALGMAGLAGLITLAVVLTFRTPQGVIQIESEVDNVRVELVDERDRADVIAVAQGEAITTVRAGRYRIRLDSPSDGIEISPQEVVVTKNKIAIAKIKKVATKQAVDDAAPDPAAKRDPVVALEAQVQLDETIAELASAKNQPEPDSDLIKTLEAKLLRLRALSRPIPTEPVYEGRTLADWAAQMKFEQERHARSVAATNVLKLAGSRPDDERMRLVLDAGARLFEWDRQPADRMIHMHLDRGRTAFSNVTWQIQAVDSQVASQQLSDALLSDHEFLRDFALVVCAELRVDLQQGKLPAALEALQERCQSDRGAGQAVALLTYGLAVPKETAAVETLARVNAAESTEDTLRACLHAVQDRMLSVPRSTQLEWVGAYVAGVEHPAYVERVLWGNSAIGPLRSVAWDAIDESRQADVNVVMLPLLRALRTCVEAVDEDPSNLALQEAAATKMNALTWVIDQVNLTSEARVLAVPLLVRRLDQLLRFRVNFPESLQFDIDTPAAVAAAHVLLTGKVPAAIKQLNLRETGYLAEQLTATRKALTPTDGVLMVQGSRGPLVSDQVAAWYPYEVLATFQESKQKMVTQAQSRVSSQRSPFRGAFSPLSARRPGRASLVDNRLLLDFAAVSPSAAEVVTNMAVIESLRRNLIRHPAFAARVTEFMEEANNAPAAKFGLHVWRQTKSRDEQRKKLLTWLASDEPVHMRVAIDEITSYDPGSPIAAGISVEDQAPAIAEAIDRIAAAGQLTVREMYILEQYAHLTPQAGRHAAAFLKAWLENPQDRPKRGAVTWDRRSIQSSALTSCVQILLRNPADRATVIDAVKKVLQDDSVERQDLAQLKRLGVTAEVDR